MEIKPPKIESSYTSNCIIKSDCCGANIRTQYSGDFSNRDKGIGTNYYICTKCNKACDAITTGKSSIEKKLIRNAKTPLVFKRVSDWWFVLCMLFVVGFIIYLIK